MKLMIKCLMLLSISVLIAFGQHRNQKKQKRELYLAMSQVGPQVDSFMRANNLHIAQLVNASKIDPGNQMIVNEDVLKAEVMRLFPDPNATGMGILDYEGKAFDILTSKLPGDSTYDAALKKFIRAVQVAKETRPKVKWSVYAIPFRNYWNMNKDWESRCLGTVPLLKVCDFITPSLYTFYPDSVAKGGEQTYVHGNIQMALKIGSLTNRPVYPFIWHRLPKLDLIPKKEFLGHVQRICDENYNGRKINGLIWYGEDVYGYNAKNKKMLSEVGDKSNLSPYLGKLISSYGSGILQLLKR